MKKIKPNSHLHRLLRYLLDYPAGINCDMARDALGIRHLNSAISDLRNKHSVEVFGCWDASASYPKVKRYYLTPAGRKLARELVQRSEEVRCG